MNSRWQRLVDKRGYKGMERRVRADRKDTGTQINHSLQQWQAEKHLKTLNTLKRIGFRSRQPRTSWNLRLQWG